MNFLGTSDYIDCDSPCLIPMLLDLPASTMHMPPMHHAYQSLRQPRTGVVFQTHGATAWVEFLNSYNSLHTLTGTTIPIIPTALFLSLCFHFTSSHARSLTSEPEACFPFPQPDAFHSCSPSFPTSFPL